MHPVLFLRASLRRIRLSMLLAGINVLLLLVTVTGVALVALHLLQQLADQQALARVTQAGVSAQRAVSRSGDDLVSAALLLAERPTLKHDLDSGNTALLPTYLDQYRHSSRFDGCAVLLAGQVIAASGPAFPWAAILAGIQKQNVQSIANGPFLSTQPGSLPLLLGGWAVVPSEAGVIVLTVDQLDATFAKQISAEINLPVALLSRSAALSATNDPRFALRQHVLADNKAVAAYLAAPGIYLDVEPVRTPTSQVAGVLETTLPATETTNTLHQFAQTLIALAIVTVVLAAAISFFIGRRLGRPLLTLTIAAARIGSGDLATPIRSAPSAEIGTLAATLEEMRARLLRLTGDLRRQQAEAEAILTGIVEGVFTVDRERRIRYLNPQAAELLGIAPEQAFGRFCGDVLNPRSRNGMRPCEEQCPIVHARFRGATQATEHLRLANGQQRTIIITSAAAVEEQQVQVMRDESAVEATRRLRDTVLANISHEFRTPLAAQQASIELLLERMPQLSVEQASELVLALQRGTLRLTQLIDNLLESVRIESGNAEIRRQPLALDEVIEEALDMTRPLLRLRDQEANVDLPYPLPLVKGDAPRLTQVFVNLLANANKFAPVGSTITIGGKVEQQQVTLWVEDEGPGLPPQAGAALFERFARAAGEEPEQSGMGLGLWIAKSLVERHGGQIAAQRWGNSTRMCVTLPVIGAKE